MARVKKRIVLEGFSGVVGRHLILCRRPDGSVVVTATAQMRMPSAKQQANWDRFRAAVAYAREAKDRDIYRKSAQERGSRPFQVATADFLHPPEILGLDLSGYGGCAGDQVVIRARDDVLVSQVGVLITDENNCLLEMGLAEQDPADHLRWVYRARKNVEGRHVRIIVDAADLPGHVCEERAELELPKIRGTDK